MKLKDMLHGGSGSVEEVKKLAVQYREKKNTFVSGCQEQIDLPNFRQDDISNLESWREQNLANATLLESEVKNWLGGTAADVLGEEIRAKDSASQISRSFPMLSTTSSAKAWLTERRITLQSKKKMTDVVKVLEAEEFKITKEFEEKQRLLRTKAEEIDLKCEL